MVYYCSSHIDTWKFLGGPSEKDGYINRQEDDLNLNNVCLKLRYEMKPDLS